VKIIEGEDLHFDTPLGDWGCRPWRGRAPGNGEDRQAGKFPTHHFSLATRASARMFAVMDDRELIEKAREAALRAYAPYSGFSVGCAIESVDGEVVTGANMENACYRLGICAEQSTLTLAQHAFGLGKVARIAVAGGDGSGRILSGELVCTPCGGCRQAILEAAQVSGHDVEILCANGNGDQVERHLISTLIPHGFGPANLADAG
jgi:cytidine deaminase